MYTQIMYTKQNKQEHATTTKKLSMFYESLCFTIKRPVTDYQIRCQIMLAVFSFWQVCFVLVRSFLIIQ